MHLHERFDRIEAMLGELPTKEDVRRLEMMLRAVYDDEAGNRRLLQEMRTDAGYELAYTDEAPLVSVIIPTYDNYEALRDRAIPSVLEQTYGNVEAVVVGEQSPPETAAVIESFDDPRIRYTRLPMRGPYDTDRFDAWLVSGTQPADVAMRTSRGAWIVPFADDDALRPDHVETLLGHARAERLEFCYGKALTIMKDGRQWEVGEFPPRITQLSMQAGIFHAGLTRFDLRLSDATFGTPNDWGWCSRAIVAGVRIGMIDRVTVDIYPGPSWRPRAGLSPTAIG